MADRIIKSDSGNDVVIQNNGGTRKIEVTNSGDVEVTGDFKATTVKATNLKANDGTASLEIADSSGDIGFSGNTNLKIKLPSSGGIYESDGSTEILTESGGSVSIQNVSIASSVTGQGLTLGMELWRLNTNVTNDDNPLGQSGGEWSIGTGNDTNTGVDSYRTGLVSESNGTFTINENGYFFITANLQVVESGTANGFLGIEVSDSSSSGYVNIARGYAITESASNAVANAQTNALIKITGSAPYNHKYLRLNFDTNDSTMFANGGTNANETYIIFHKISDV